MKPDKQIINDYLLSLYGSGISFGWGFVYRDDKNTISTTSEGLEFVHTILNKDAEFPHISVAYKYRD